MDNKKAHKSDEPSAYHLNPLASKSQASGQPIEEIKQKEISSGKESRA